MLNAIVLGSWRGVLAGLASRPESGASATKSAKSHLVDSALEKAHPKHPHLILRFHYEKNCATKFPGAR
jgi:hypothetical protein